VDGRPRPKRLARAREPQLLVALGRLQDLEETGFQSGLCLPDPQAVAADMFQSVSP
jgi:hypothetical protein